MNEPQQSTGVVSAVAQVREPPPPAEHRTVARVMAIIEHVLAAEDEGMRLAELAPALDAPKSSVHGLVKGLVATGYFREEGGRYLPGPAIAHIVAARPSAISSAYHSVLEELRDKWGETTMLATLVGESVVYLDKVESKSLIRASAPLHTRRPLWPTAAGKCFLGFMGPKRIDSYLARLDLSAETHDRAVAEIAEAGEAGFAMNIGEVDPDHIGLAAPIVRAGGGGTRLAITVGGPSVRVRELLPEMTADLLNTVRTLSSVGGVR